MVQPREQRLGGEDLHARRRQLDRQRQPVQARANLRDGGSILRAQSKLRAPAAGAVDQ